MMNATWLVSDSKKGLPFGVLIRLKFDRTSDSILPRKSKMLIVEKDK